MGFSLLFCTLRATSIEQSGCERDTCSRVGGERRGREVKGEEKRKEEREKKRKEKRERKRERRREERNEKRKEKREEKRKEKREEKAIPGPNPQRIILPLPSASSGFACRSLGQPPPLSWSSPFLFSWRNFPTLPLLAGTCKAKKIQINLL